MENKKIRIGQTVTEYYFGASLSGLKNVADKQHTILVTDEHVYDAYKQKLKGWNTIVIKAGEEFKIQETADALIDSMIEMEADRKTTLIGLGGGVVTDLTGYVGSIYMRGIRTGFIPTSLLAMVDASIGGKNGVDVGVYKNLVGCIRQPAFLYFDTSLLQTLPESEWQNGFAEIIKHAAIKDVGMFRELSAHDFDWYRKKKPAIAALVRRNALLKTKVVQGDETEQGDRKLLNFGHTLGHALENQYELSHGQAVAIGMTYAAHLSEELVGFRQAERLVELIARYGLPTYADFDRSKVFDVLKHDKKRERSSLHYILLQKIGKGIIHTLPLQQVKQLIEKI
ncbi:3-dehydroquinate synthase [Flavihumibacter sp. CACIAM 22H1]|uniref:3-dehydroquinate synthase n=1 Tax=Flavihumibacter sp. CACIAM 22H1 TaxID=1812911 RepID=UPI0007A9312B|nr:3-dehydroquinate synthase [Flavihumibacter sp. CACIAM 22H1]KYP13422.1 MAG: 3-dehydroquinate synthase [Flavihumibacter sp. CACIAM 22H1]